MVNTSARQFKLSSPAFTDGQPIPEQYTCRGQNVSPPLTITGTPETAKSLALIMHDPDAVSGDYTHWLMWGIPAQTVAIDADSLPVGAIQGPNDVGKNSYTGPCPPAGTGRHHYIFELYALDAALDLDPRTDRHQLEQVLANHGIDRCRLTGLFDAAG